MRAEVDAVMVEWSRESSRRKVWMELLPTCKAIWVTLPQRSAVTFIEATVQRDNTGKYGRKWNGSKNKSLKPVAWLEFASVYACLIRIDAGIAGRPA